MTGARATWHSITPAQRRVLDLIVAQSAKLVRSPNSPRHYDAVASTGVTERAAGLLTVRNMERRELVSWNGGAFDPEREALVTERARFVVRHGKPTP